jgi:hypothetical protein
LTDDAAKKGWNNVFGPVDAMMRGRLSKYLRSLKENTWRSFRETPMSMCETEAMNGGPKG